MPYKPRGSEIYVDIGVLQEEVRRIEEVARALLAEEREIFAALESASPQAYDGELRKQVMEIAGEDPRMLRQFAEGLMLQAEELKRVAGAFEMADAMEVRGRLSLAASIYTLAERGYDLAEFPWWLVHRGRPPWMDRAAWDRLSARQREALFAWLEAEWQRFVAGTDTRGFRSQTKLMEAFSVHVFLAGLQEQTRAPWVSDEVWAGLLAEDRADLLARSEWLYKTTPLPALGAWKSAAELAGVTLEQFVMDALHITPYERDTVAGVALAETRTSGPVGMLLCEVTYLNRVRDGSMWGSYEAAWKGFTKVGEYNFELDGATHYGRAYADYLTDSLGGGTAQGDTAIFSASNYFHYLENKDLYMHAAAATAAQDMSWRLLAGHRLSELTSESQVAHFLGDSESQWWKYQSQLMDADLVVYDTYSERYAEQLRANLLEHDPARYEGNEQQLIIDVNNVLRNRYVVPYPDPSTMDGAVEMVERAYGYGNQYESNPSTTSFVEFRQVKYDPAMMALEFPGLPSDTQIVVFPKYAQMVYSTARGLADQGLPLGEVYLDHYRSLVMVMNIRNGVGFASYYFPPEDPAHLPNYP